MSSVPQTGPSAGPQLNRQLAALVAARWPLIGRRTPAPEPQRLACRRVLGVARVQFGYAVNLQFVYHSTQPEPYLVEGYITGCDDGPLTGESYARSCTCPDFIKRRGAARDQLRGEARCCKHMLLFQLLAYTWRGRQPWGGILGMVFPAPAASAPAPVPAPTPAQPQRQLSQAAAAALVAPGRKSSYVPGRVSGKAPRRANGGK